MTDRTVFARILDEYLRALEAGNAPDRHALLVQHPELAEELRAALLGIDFVHGAAPRLAPEENTGEQADALPGGMLGDYRLLRELGRGGMAVVYEAEQISLGRHVALKVLPFAAVLDPKQLQRFKNEAMAAAHLHHSNIVPVYGVGCERGVHYYAMQYIEGQSLATAIRDMRGGEERAPRDGPKTPISSHGSNREPAYIRIAAKLGVQAAKALDHAHQLGIVHRDVKPGNLLADLAGTLWVTDFGLASSKKDVGLTITGELLGTIRYMSPEQALAKRVPIDHRTDVYSLGATLYELFTLQPAFPGDNPHLVIQDIAFKEPVLPRRLNPALPRDLETVLLKAMWKDPSGRYATAQEMADDLERFLENRPIEAKRAGLVRRASKWSRRHRSFVGATLVVLLLSTAGLATGTALLWREQGHTKSALASSEANLNLALQALDQIYIDEAEGHPKLREGLPRDLLQRGLGFYEKFVEENAGNKGIVFLLGNAYLSAGLIFRALGEEARAVEYFDRAITAFDRAIEIDPGNALPHNNRGAALSGLRRFEESLAEYDRAIKILPGEAGLHNNRGNVLRDLGRFEESVAACDRALELDPQGAHSHNNRGAALSRLGRSEEALAAYDMAVALDPQDALAHTNRGSELGNLLHFEESLAALDRAIEINPRSTGAHSTRGHTLENLGRFEEALAACDLALEIDPLYVAAHSNRGNALGGLGRLDEGLAACDRAIELDPRAAPPYNNRCLALRRLGCFEEALTACDRAIELDRRNVLALINRGTALRDLGRSEEALAAYDRAIELNPRDASAHNNRGGVLCEDFGQPGESLAEFDRAIELNPRYAEARLNRCIALGRLGRMEESLAEFDQTIALDPRDARAHNGRGNTLVDLARFEEALAAHDKAIESDPRYVIARIRRGALLCDRLDRPGDALAEFDRAIALEPRSAVAYANRAIALRNLGRVEQSLEACDRAIALDSRSAMAHAVRGLALGDLRGPEEALAEFDLAIKFDPKYADAHRNRGSVLRELKRLEEALAAFDLAVKFNPGHGLTHYNRGNALRDLGEVAAALEAYGECMRLRPNFAEPYCNFGLVLVSSGRIHEAVPYLRRGHELGSKRADWAYPSAEWLADAERKADLEVRLDQWLSGKAQPQDAAERSVLALALYDAARHADSARMYAQAFAEDAALAEDLAQAHRYVAACAAALAGAAGGADAAESRGRALEWLRADLAARVKAPSRLAATLEHWQQDPDFASVRDRLGDLPEPERAAWSELWVAVDLALEAARAAAK